MWPQVDRLGVARVVVADGIVADDDPGALWGESDGALSPLREEVLTLRAQLREARVDVEGAKADRERFRQLHLSAVCEIRGLHTELRTLRDAPPAPESEDLRQAVAQLEYDGRVLREENAALVTRLQAALEALDGFRQ